MNTAILVDDLICVGAILDRNTNEVLLHGLYISGPCEIERCDHFFDTAAPLIHDKLLEHLYCLNLACHSGLRSRLTIKMLVGHVAICIDVVYEDMGKCYPTSSVPLASVSSSSGPASSQHDTSVRQIRAHVRSGIHSMWCFSSFTSRLAATGPQRELKHFCG